MSNLFAVVTILALVAMRMGYSYYKHVRCYDATQRMHARSHMQRRAWYCIQANPMHAR
jgi:hypothetical protein